MSALVVIQARMGSTRLPGKVLEPLAGRPLLGFMLDRLAGLDAGPVVVATSAHARDDQVAALVAERNGIVVRGSEHDVLSRFVATLDRNPADRVVRLTADSPLCDPAVIADALALHVTRRADYTSNSLLRTFPDGLDVEVVEADALRDAHARAVAADEREHVTPYVQRHPERYRIAELDSGRDLGHLRWTIDEPADLEAVRALVAAVPDPVRAPWPAFLAAAATTTAAPAFVPARADDDLPHAPAPVLAAARDWCGGRDAPFSRVYTDRRGAWIALTATERGSEITLAPEADRVRLVAAARALVAGDLQFTELQETSA